MDIYKYIQLLELYKENKYLKLRTDWNIPLNKKMWRDGYKKALQDVITFLKEQAGEKT
jgi:hypothetical protein